MWMSSEDARSDFLLAAAAFVLGNLVRDFVARLPGYPQGRLALFLAILWVFVLTGLVPVLLARYRKQGLAAFALDGPRDAMITGIAIAFPFALVGFLDRWTSVDSAGGEISIASAALGRFDVVRSADPVDIFLGLLIVVVVFAGAVLLYPFLTGRAREGLNRTTMPLVEALRTFGMAATAIAFTLGLLNTVRGVFDFTSIVWTVGGLAAAVLLTDQVVRGGLETTRMTILGPAIVAVAYRIFASGGGLFGSADLLFSLYLAALSGGTAIVLAVLVETRDKAWAVVPIVAAIAIYPSLLSPV